ncbi:MAG: hypothetical protein AAF675_14990 [Pseudomonadota bacterium]
MLKTWIAPAAALTLTLGLAAGDASAQGGLRGLISGTGLQSSDFEMMREAAAGLYDVSEPSIGSEAAWENAETGATGTVTLSGWDGTCADLDHSFRAGGTTTTQPFASRRCRSDAGEWVLEAR